MDVPAAAGAGLRVLPDNVEIRRTCLRDDCREDLHNKFLAESIRNNGFNPREKRLLAYFSQGLTTRDIGKRMSISHVAVVKMMHKIRVKAWKHLDKN